jgi:hypothetical protein
MSAYLTFTREKTLGETDGPTDLQANSFSSRPMLSDGAISINPCFECYSKHGITNTLEVQ